MKRAFALILALTIVILMSLVETSASTVSRMKVNIGFSFYVADSQLPAGEYWVEMVNTGLGTLVGSAPAIRSVDGSVFLFLAARAQGSDKNDPSCYLEFKHVRDSYFLSKVHQSFIEVWLPKSRTQKEIVQAYPKGSKEAQATMVSVAAEMQR
jgi:hypothetical protein